SGGGAFFGQNDTRNLSINVPERLACPGAGEIAALLKVAQSIPTNSPLHAVVKSSRLRKDLTKNLRKLEDLDWSTHEHKHLMKSLVTHLRTRSALTTLNGWDSSTPKLSTEGASSLALSAINKDQYDEIDTTVNDSLDLTGIKLDAGSQKIFYTNIKNTLASPKQRRHTKMNLARTQYAVCEINAETPTSAQIWKSIRDSDTPRNIRSFLWKGLHGAYKIGDFWDKIPHYEHRGSCGLCGALESMEHILIECESTVSRVIWDAAKNLWLKREPNWPVIKFGTILGCNLTIIRNTKGKKKLGSTRLFKIIILESAHLIWKLRCERAIKFGGDKDKYHCETEILNRWIHAINLRLKFDRLLTDSMRYGKKALRTETVLQTWSGTLQNEDNLRDNWIQKSEVLVGMALRRPPGRNR
ncbi:ribonuclease H-like protein, partial [Suillus subluteus]